MLRVDRSRRFEYGLRRRLKIVPIDDSHNDFSVIKRPLDGSTRYPCVYTLHLVYVSCCVI